MKLAFLFLTLDDHRQGAVWQRFFHRVRRTWYSIYCHAKHPSRVRQRFLRSHLLPHRVETQHGGVSLVRASLLLLRQAFEDPDNEYFIFVSESCVPLYSFRQVRDRLQAVGRSWICFGSDDREETIERWKQVSDHVPWEDFKKQHQWMVLTRDLAAMLLDQDETSAFEAMYAADEHYVVNTLARRGADLSQVKNQACTFANWEEYEATRVDGWTKLRPKTYLTLSAQDVLHARSQGCLFLRKVSADCDCSALQAADTALPGPPPLAAIRLEKFFSVVVPVPSGPSALVECVASILKEDPEALSLEVLVSAQTGDFYRDVNAGLGESCGTWVHVLPADSLVVPGCYTRLRQILEGVPQQVGVVAFHYVSIDESGAEFSPPPAAEAPGILGPDWGPALLDGNPLNIAAVVFRRSLFERLGTFYEDLSYCSDWEFFLRSIPVCDWWYQADTLVTCRLRPLAPEMAARADGDVRSTFERTAIHYHRLGVPLGPQLRPQSSNFFRQ